MAKIESFRKEPLTIEDEIAALESTPVKEPSRFTGLAGKLFDITKLVLGLCLLPFVYAISIAFFNEVSLIDAHLERCLWAGMVSLAAVYLFVWEPAAVYGSGQKILEVVFRFFKPLVKVAPNLLPIYTIVIFVAGLFLSYMAKGITEYLVFFMGFTLTMHLIYSAKSMRSRKGDFLKANYIFGFSFIYIINVLILAFFLNVLLDKFSFVHFVNQTYQTAQGIFGAVLHQLFSVNQA